jgi:cellulose synthase/poly-beta-1,6-N-acetylglucosamine synthase-like glycosyltransferase
MKVVFWLLALATVYSYFIYAGLLLFCARRRAPVLAFDNAELPMVSLIVTAYNEAGRVRAKLENSLELDYPQDRLEIIVASDCSEDETDSIVGEFAALGVRLVRADQRKGKEYAQYCAIQQARGEILVFSDVATNIPAGAIKLLANYFANPRIGAVSSEDRFISQSGSIAGEGAYVRYEMWLRRQESRCAGLVGLSGSFFAARAEVCQQWDIYSPSDFNTALNCIQHGLIAVTAPDVHGFYKDIVDSKREYQRKVRTVLRGMTALQRHPEVLSFRRFGLFAFQLWSHKIMRWAVPWLMLALLIVSFCLVDAGFIYRLALVAQLAFYAVAIIGWLFPASRKVGPTQIIFFVMQVNVALAHSLVKLLKGERIYVWKPSER